MLDNINVNLDKPSVLGLVFLLRHEAWWPEGFRWDYNHHEQCALGLMNAYWVIKRGIMCTADASDVLGITQATSSMVFTDVYVHHPVRPTDVADRLEELYRAAV